MKRIFHALRRALLVSLNLDRRLDELKINQGQLLSNQQLSAVSGSLVDHEFKVFSQYGEDGILQYLTRNLRIERRTFIEFGVEDFFESNCRFLLMKDLWRGFVIDGSADNIARLRASYFYWRYQLDSRASFITRENVSSILDESGFDRSPGILSIDLDGMDYHVLGALADWRPSIFIVEYNAVFGAARPVTVPYDPTFQRTRSHFSNLYFGASLPAFSRLLAQRGYGFVGANSMGNNAFFVRRDLLNDRVGEIGVAEGYRDSVFRESRDAKGRLTLLSGSDRIREMADMPLLDVSTSETIRVGDLAK